MKRFLVATAIAVLALMTPTYARDFDFDLDDANSAVFDGPVKVHVGDTIRLVVDENPSTGYRWDYNTHSERGISAEEAVYTVHYDEHHMHNLRASVQADGDAAPRKTGEGGTRVIELHAA